MRRNTKYGLPSVFYALLLLGLIPVCGKAQVFNSSEHVLIDETYYPWLPTVVKTVDLDKDGDLDIVSASLGNNGKLAWYENNGACHYKYHLIAYVGNFLERMEIADADNDGDMDVFYALYSSNVVAWYENDGNQNFQYHTITFDIVEPKGISISDVNGDGFVDVVVSSEDEYQLFWFENQGNRTFTKRVITSKVPVNTRVYTLDMDIDGDLDILAMSPANLKLYWYKNDGDANFVGRPVSYNSDRPGAAFPVDLDKDGDIDILTVSQSKDRLVWFENGGGMNFTERIIETGAGPVPIWVHGVDFDGDEDVDILIYYRDSNEIRLLQNDGQNGFEGKTLYTQTGFGWDIEDIEVVDFDGNSTWDLVLPLVNDKRIIVLTNDGVGISDTVVISVSARGVNNVRANDFDGDGDVDLVSGNTTTDQLMLYENTGDQAFCMRYIDLEMFGRSMSLADVDGDDDSDVVVASNSNIWWLENEGGLTFNKYRISSKGTSTNSITAIDMDKDGDVDIVSSEGGLPFSGGKIIWHDNDGEEQFVTDTIFRHQDPIYLAKAADMDGDGDGDVVAFLDSANVLFWLENNGNLVFSMQVISAGSDMRDIVIEDLDQDTDMDIIVLTQYGTGVFWYENEGNYTFTRRTIIEDGVSGRAVCPTDLDGDGDRDVVVASNALDKIIWFENDGSQEFFMHETPYQGRSVKDIFSVDMDGDGDQDLLSASADLDKVAWHENLTIAGVNTLNYVDLGFLVSPNPYSEWVKLQCDACENQFVEIQLFDYGGNRLSKQAGIWTGIKDQMEHRLSQLHPGYYIINVKTGEGFVVSRSLVKL